MDPWRDVTLRVEQVRCQLEGKQVVTVKGKRARATPNAWKLDAVKWNNSGDYS
jgi:hypothetical protein